MKKESHHWSDPDVEEALTKAEADTLLAEDLLWVNEEEGNDWHVVYHAAWSGGEHSDAVDRAWERLQQLRRRR